MNEEITDEISQDLEQQLYPEKCPKCGRGFKNPMALRMHNARVHGNLRGNPLNRSAKTLEQVRAEKREYNLRLRERYYREGRNSRGQMMPEGWKPRRHHLNLDKKTKKEKLSAYKREWWKRNKANKSTIHRTMHVWPPGGQEQPKPQQQLNYCPKCGEHLGSWSKMSTDSIT